MYIPGLGVEVCRENGQYTQKTSLVGHAAFVLGRIYVPDTPTH